MRTDTSGIGTETYALTSGYVVENGIRYTLGFWALKRDYMGTDYFHADAITGKMFNQNVGDELEFYWVPFSDVQDTVIYTKITLKAQ